MESKYYCLSCKVNGDIESLMKHAKTSHHVFVNKNPVDLKKIKELEYHLRSNGDSDLEDEYISLHNKLNIRLPKDFEKSTTTDRTKR